MSEEKAGRHVQTKKRCCSRDDQRARAAERVEPVSRRYGEWDLEHGTCAKKGWNSHRKAFARFSARFSELQTRAARKRGSREGRPAADFALRRAPSPVPPPPADRSEAPANWWRLSALWSLAVWVVETLAEFL